MITFHIYNILVTKWNDGIGFNDIITFNEWLYSIPKSRIRRSKQVKGETNENKCKQEESLYIALTETEQIDVVNGNVTFCSHFKYLGSWISFSLWDDHDVAKRIASANASTGAMSAFWDENHVDVYSKFIIFRAIPCNLLLWGYEIWALRQTLSGALEVLLHRSVRRIIQIKMRHVIEHRIKNEQVRDSFLTYRRFETKLPFVNSLTLGKLSEEKELTFPHASSQRGATILEKWEDRYSQTSSASSEISKLSYLKLMTMVP